jgi:hypothetical protein
MRLRSVETASSFSGITPSREIQLGYDHCNPRTTLSERSRGERSSQGRGGGPCKNARGGCIQLTFQEDALLLGTSTVLTTEANEFGIRDLIMVAEG